MAYLPPALEFREPIGQNWRCGFWREEMSRRSTLPTRLEFWSAVMRMLGTLTLIVPVFIAIGIWSKVDVAVSIGVIIGGMASALPIFALSAIIDGVSGMLEK